MDEAAIPSFDRIRNDLEVYARTVLRIRDKSGALVPFALNKVQREAHRRLETQKTEKGWVRALILKGRQTGISTYIAGRYYHQATMNRGANVYILAHEQAASDTLFGIVDRFQRTAGCFAPHVGVSNVKELVFDRIDSSYCVATAGNKAGGRSKSISLYHGSEVAYWTNAKDHFASSVQAVPLAPGSEIVLESTSAGASGEFYERWMDAEAGEGDYIPIFLPWFLSDSSEYRRDPEPGFELRKEADDGELSEAEYADIYNISLPQMAFRRSKISELRNLSAFKREYPASASEAWTSDREAGHLIDMNLIIKARKRQQKGVGPLILGVDPASLGGDRFAIAARRGNCVEWVRYRNKIDHNEGTLWIRSLIDDLKPARVFIDMGHIGVTVVSNLKGIGPQYAEIVRGINFGAASETKVAKPKAPGPANRRAEMWDRLREWLASEEQPTLPDDDHLQSDLAAVIIRPKPNGDFLLESKLEMRKRGIRSPDMGDAIALTFATREYFRDYHDEGKLTTFASAPEERPYYAERSPEGWMA